MSSEREFSSLEKVLLALLFLTLLAALLVYIITLFGLGFANSPDDFANFGDYVGGTIGTIVALTGVVFLYRTYRLQLDISAKQEEKFDRQLFESSFFLLLDQQRDILKSMKGEYSRGQHKMKEKLEGVDYMARLRLDLSVRLLDLNYEPAALDGKDTNKLKIIVNQIYQDFFQGHASQLGHYFRHLYHIVKFVAESGIEDKKPYMDLIQAQMSTDELYLSAINGISNYGRKNMLPLMNQYSLLENLIIDDDPIVTKLIRIFYPKTKQKRIENLKKNIIFVGGVHAVGKSRFAEYVKKDNDSVNLLSASEILKWKDSKEKEVENVGINQNLLVENLQRLVDIDKPYLLDGHFCLMNSNGEIERVPMRTFQDINPEMIILLVEDVEVILKRLKDRDDKKYDPQLIELLCENEYSWAHDVADYLGVDIYTIKVSEYEKVKPVISDFVSQFM